MNPNPLQTLFGILNKLNPKQKFMLGGGVVLTLAMLSVLLFFLNEPNYTSLYSGLSQEDASKVVEYLANQKVLYKIEDNGQNIKVPSEKVYELRLALAGKGILNSGIIGYEIFDKSTMGMSEYMQKLNYKRALEGELVRTIQKLDCVTGASVKITVPEKSIFKDEEVLPSASVVLKLKTSQVPPKENIQAVINLLVGSVEGLQQSKVSIIDTKGRILNTENEEGPLAFASSRQYEIKKSVENYLVQKAQSMLDNVLGYGNSMVQVNADLNFDQVEKTMENYDPDSQVAVSEQTIKINNQGKVQRDSTAQSNNNTLTNYEISKSIEKVITGSGNIKRLSVAAVINDIPKEVKNGTKTNIVFEPRPQDQIRKLEEIIKNAVGLDLERKDQFSITNIPFETKIVEDIPEEIKSSVLPDADQWVNLTFIIVAIVSSILVLKSLMKRLKNERIVIGTINPGQFEMSGDSLVSNALPQSHSPAPQLIAKKKRGLLPMGDIEDDISDEAMMKKNQQERIVNYVSKNPMDAAKLINAWMHEDEI